MSEVFIDGDVLKSFLFGGRVIVVEIEGELMADLGPLRVAQHRMSPWRYNESPMKKIGNTKDNPELGWEHADAVRHP